ncbi:MAG: xylulokinase, partial [Chthonomonadaceae bacterium]|nr:xylulokinase [Chthonomonadaceae bacterium]
LPISQVRASGGGAKSSLWRQIQADVTGYTHVTIDVDEGPALGVALLAGVGTGVYESVEEACRATIRVSHETAPNLEHKKIYDAYHEVYRSLYRNLKDDFAKVTQLSSK